MTKEEKQKRLNNFLNNQKFWEYEKVCNEIIAKLGITEAVLKNWLKGRTIIPDGVCAWFDQEFECDIFFDFKSQERRNQLTEQIISIADQMRDYICENCKIKGVKCKCETCYFNTIAKSLLVCKQELL